MVQSDDLGSHSLVRVTTSPCFQSFWGLIPPIDPVFFSSEDLRKTMSGCAQCELYVSTCTELKAVRKVKLCAIGEVSLKAALSYWIVGAV